VTRKSGILSSFKYAAWNRLIRLFLIVPFLGFLESTGAQAQEFAYEYWHDGKMVLETGDTLKGKLKYNLQTDLLQLEASNRIETFTSRKVVFFEIFDGTVKRYRQFYSLPYTTSAQYKAPVFFELLEEGKITLLSREALEYRTYSSFYYGSYSKLVMVDKFYFLKENGTIQELGNKKGGLIDLLESRREEIEKFIKANKLKIDNKYDAAKVVGYYNSLFNN
jgi:hypothetical protein